MKVKIGDTVYNGDDVRIMVILTDKDKENIARMEPECDKYCEFPQTDDEQEVARWMSDVWI